MSKTAKSFWLGFGLIVIVAVGVYWAYTQTGSGQAGDGHQPQISVTPASYDWGVVSATAGPVSQQFTVTNEGAGDLVIKKISTSCGCTTASLTTAKRTTPSLGMDHGNLPSIKETIAPDESASLTVTFDPNFHYVRGPVSRVVYILSNDPNNKEVEVENRLVVTD